MLQELSLGSAVCELYAAMRWNRDGLQQGVSVHLNPRSPNLVCVGESDGKIRLHDLRTESSVRTLFQARGGGVRDCDW